MKRIRIWTGIILLISLAVIGWSNSIGLVEIAGNTTIPTYEIQEVIRNTKEGARVTIEQIEQDIFLIEDMGYFQSVSYRLAPYIGDVKMIVFELVEHPFVSDITVRINGSNVVRVADLNPLIQIKKDRAFNHKMLIRSTNAIRTYYSNQGYIPQLIEVRTNMEIAPNGQFFIPEGKLEIKVIEYGLYDIQITGEMGDITLQEVKDIMQLELLKDFYADFWRIFRNKAVCYPKLLTLQLALNSLYNTGLYGPETEMYFNALEEPLETGEHGVYLVLKIQLNPVVPKDHPVQEVIIKGNTLLSHAELMPGLRSPYNPTTVLMDVLRDTELMVYRYKDAGYPVVLIHPTYSTSTQTLTFTITESVVQEIRIRGLTKTREDLVMREVRLKPGQPVTERDWVQTYINLNRTQYFSDIRMEPIGFARNSPGTIFVITLEESPYPLTMNAGLTFDPSIEGSVIQQISGNMSFEWINPTGQGETISLNAVLGRQPEFGFSYAIKNLFGSNFDAGISLNYSRKWDLRYFRDEDERIPVRFEVDSFRIVPNVGLRIGDFHFLGADVTWGSFNRHEVPATATTIAPSGIVTVLGLNYSFDTRDDLTSPTSGYEFYIRGEYSGLGATEDWFQMRQFVRGFWTPWRDHTFAGRLFAGEILYNPLEVLEYKIGGPRSALVRGILDSRSQLGQYALAANMEYRYQIIRQDPVGLGLVGFIDAGMAFNDASEFQFERMLASFGFGMRITIPGFGLLRFDTGWNMRTLEWGGFSFGFGQMF